MKTIAIFASGNGSNFERIIQQINNKEIDANCALLVCNKKNAYVLERAKRLGIETYVFSPKDYNCKKDYELLILNELKKHNVEFIVLAGYMLLLGDTLLEEFENKIVNIHPSLLPAFKGKNAIEQAIEHGVKMIGVTVHYVDAGMDTGTIIDQEGFYIEEEMTITMIEEKIHTIEHELYPKVLKKILSEV